MTLLAHMQGILAGIKRRLFRSTPRTPYDRPPTAARSLYNTTSVNESDNDGRLLKFVESVSSLITRIASKFFSFVCRSREKNFVKLDAPTVNSVEQRLVEANNLSTSKDIGISDIEKQIIQRRNERANVIHLLKMIKSQSSKIHNSGVPKKVLKRDHTFLDDDESLLCHRPRKIHKNLGEKKKQVVDNITFTTNPMESAITTNDMDNAFTASRSISRSISPIIKSTNTTASCHATLPLQKNSGVENAQFTAAILEDVIATNGLNDASSLSRCRESIISSINAIISSHVAPPSAPAFLDLDEENVETNTYVQSLMDLDQPKTNLLEQKSSEVENKQKKVLKRDRSFLYDEESLLCHPRKIHKKLGEKKKQVVDNISFTTAAMKGAIATNNIIYAFTSSRSSLLIIESTNATVSCHATLLSQRKPRFCMSAPEFLDIDEENDETNIYVQSSMDLDQPK
ncbi:uncharacterized protein LOC110028492 [Phalaenopsis equestris]|uniref:uncharacterized protein LOC110028492 n=1 Tax=Phalaenopsis equestris TaxID=78828 RepID=UPI0009E1A5CA|nr:uncharacterized protein LOC110028492 [Phalaenopsis equestris]